MSAFSPPNCQQVSTSHKIVYLAERFSKIIENIAPQNRIDIISDKLRCYTCDDDVRRIMNKPYEEFWMNVSKLVEGESMWSKYPVLSRFALAMATAFHANSDTERAFSVQTDIHRNPKKNSICWTPTCRFIMGLIRKAMLRCVLNVLNTRQQQRIFPDTHCCVAVITEDMLENCSVHWKDHKTKKNAPPADKETVITITEKTKEDAVKRKLKFAGTLKTRLTLYPDNFMSPVYGDDEKESTNTSTAEGSMQKKVSSSTSSKKTGDNQKKKLGEGSMQKKVSSSTISKKTDDNQKQKSDEGSKQKKVNSLKRKETHAVAFTPFPPKAPKKTRKEDQ